MTILNFTNNAASTLATSITSTATTIVLATGTGSKFPANNFKMTLLSASNPNINEIIFVNSVTSDTLNVVRGQEGTTAQSWNSGDLAQLLVTAGGLQAFVQTDQLQASTYTSASAGGTANSLTATLPSSLTTLPNNLSFIILAEAANTGAATLTLTLGSNVQPAYPIVKYGNVALTAGDIPAANYPIQLVYSTAFSAFVMTNPATGSTGSLAGGGTNTVVYQSSTGVTSYVSPGPSASGQVLEWNGSNFTWANISGAVASFNGRTGIVTPQTGDYTAAQVGAVSTASTTGANQQLTNTGFQVLPGGLIIQWGSVNGATTPSTITFPKAFPNVCFMVIGGNTLQRNSVTSSVFSWNQTSFSFDQTGYLSWIALGY